MNLCHKILKEKLRLLGADLTAILHSAWMVGFAFIFFSCIDDIPVDNPSNSADTGDLVEVTLPGYIGIKLNATGLTNTRDGESSDEVDDNKWAPSFSNGNGEEDEEYEEYALAPGDNNHFILIYKSIDKGGSDNDTPLVVISLSFTEKNIKQDGNSITLTAKSVLTSKSLTPIFTRIESFADQILDGNEAFVVLNFDCSIIDKENTTARISSTNSNVFNLARMTRSQFLSLPVKNYKIHIGEKDYFTMSNSVCLDNNWNVNYNYYINTENVNSPQEEPAIEAYVERLAVKYTLNFKEGTFNSGVSQPTQDELDSYDDSHTVSNFNNDGYYGWDNSTNLPYYMVSIKKYVTYDFDSSKGGYEIKSENTNATVQVVGYGVSNLEKNSYLLKKIQNQNYFSIPNGKTWNDPDYRRSYWSEDFNYNLSQSNKPLTNANGYPHQFRYALETDTITSLFVNNGSGYTYTQDPYFEDVTIKVNGQNRTTRYYREIGEINNQSLNSNCVLGYKSFDDLKDNFQDHICSVNEGKTGNPFYSLENTYYDAGMSTGYETSGIWTWEWKRAPYSAAANLILLCKLTIDGNNNNMTVYRGQNDIFYFNLWDDKSYQESTALLNSKLGILNDVMLNGGNAGFQIFDGKWDSHQRGTKETILDKIAWNENSQLWISKTILDENDKVIKTEYEIPMIPQHLDLIPAELSGGDGQALIAPAEKYMGKEFHYYIAPHAPESTKDKPVMDQNLAVEISFNHLVGLIHKIIGPVDVFTNGYMYYALPISHNEKYFIESNENDHGMESWRSLGKIGVVRNNWYDLTVESIGSVGTPVHVTAQPIVPVMDVKRSYINMGVKLLNWHNIRQGNVPM